MTDTQRTVTLREARRLASFNEPVLIEQDTLRELLRLATPSSEEATGPWEALEAVQEVGRLLLEDGMEQYAAALYPVEEYLAARATPPPEEATGLREALERIAALGPKGPFLMVTDELREAQDIARAALAKGSE
jgi:aspartate aminotransferase-like enzyme